MNEPDYTKIIALLDEASAVLAAQTGNLNPADLRIRSLVSITGREAQRALLETAVPPDLPTSAAETPNPRAAAGNSGVSQAPESSAP